MKNVLLVVMACFALSACATKKVSTQLQSDVYTGNDTVEYLAKYEKYVCIQMKTKINFLKSLST